ncbi:MAG: cytochrome c biogenesis CcdA family protein [Halanaerobiaceae bacterium]
MQQELTIPLAFSAGLLSILSPCILPLIPSYLGILTGSNPKEINSKWSLLKPALAFIAGFSIIFILLGLSASWIGQFLLRQQFELARFGGIIIILFGLHTLGAFNLPFININLQSKIPAKITGNLKAFIFGLVIALAWTPCIGPVLGTILVFAGSSGNLSSGFMMMSAYSIGLSIPFLLAALFLDYWLSKIKQLNPYLPWIKKISGITLILVGILISTGAFTSLTNLLV